jgi:hypothetical protein
MRQSHPSLWMDNHIKAHNFFVNQLGELVPSAIQSMEAIEVPVEEVSGYSQLSMFSL